MLKRTSNEPQCERGRFWDATGKEEMWAMADNFSLHKTKM